MKLRKLESQLEEILIESLTGSAEFESASLLVPEFWSQNPRVNSQSASATGARSEKLFSFPAENYVVSIETKNNTTSVWSVRTVPESITWIGGL